MPMSLDSVEISIEKKKYAQSLKTMALITQLLSYLELTADLMSNIQLNLIFIQKSILIYCTKSYLTKDS